jgi:hypothetical protein
LRDKTLIRMSRDDDPEAPMTGPAAPKPQIDGDCLWRRQTAWRAPR